MNRLSPIYTSNDPSLVYNEIERLDSLYKSLYRKSLPVSLLFAAWGDKKSGHQYGITVEWEDSDSRDKSWVLENVKETT